MKAFRSAVVVKLIDEYAYKKNHDVENIYKTISEFDITEPKKQEMRRYISLLTRRLDDRFSSILFGKALRRLTGCTDMLRRCEKKLVKTNNDRGTKGYTDESLNRWYLELLQEIKVCVNLDEEHSKNLLRYIIYAQQFERGKQAQDYSELYKAYDRLM